MCWLVGCCGPEQSLFHARRQALLCPATDVQVHAGVHAVKAFVIEQHTRVEGDIQQLPAEFPVVPLWRVLAGFEPGRQAAEQVTVFDSVGFALEDYSALCLVHRLAAQHGAGRMVDLVPPQADPKDLFALTRSVCAISTALRLVA